MATPIRPKDIPTTASTAAADDYFIIDGATNGTRKYAHDRDPAAHGGIHGTPYIPPAGTLVAETKAIIGMDNGGRIVANSGAALYLSADDGATWVQVATMDVEPTGFRALSDGEVLVGVGEQQANSKKATIWKSTGWNAGTPTFTKVLEASGYSQSFSLTWAWGHDGSIVVTNEYGTDARYVYLSQDCGATWTTIYDNGVSATPQKHLHGCTYDPWRGAIWISGGDWNGIEANPHVSVSWDLGNNWTKVTGTQQPTTIVAFPNCVCFGTDNAPNGVLRINKPSASNLRIEVAYALDAAITTTYVAMGWFRGATSDLALIHYGSATAGTHAVVLGSRNGFDWFVVWENSTNQSQAMRALGPTTSGNLVIRYDLASAKSTVRIPAPVNTIESAAQLAASPTSGLSHSYAYFPNISDPSYQTITAYTNTVVQMTSIYGLPGSPYSYNRHDPDEMFSLDADGLAVTVKRAGIIQVIADGCFNALGGVVGWTTILVNGIDAMTGTGRCVMHMQQVAAGDKIATRVFTTAGTTLVGGRVLALVALAVF